MLDKASIPAIPITIQGNTYNVMIDTGSDASYLDTELLKNIPRTLLGYQEEIVGGTAIKEKGSAVYSVDFICGEKSFTEEFTENDFSYIFKFIANQTGVQLHGILGTKFLLKYKCILDFDKLIFYL